MVGILFCCAWYCVCACGAFYYEKYWK